MIKSILLMAKTASSSQNPIELVELAKTKNSTSGEEILFVDVDAVREVFGNPKYKDYYVAVYTIAGPTRSGKSFLFSLLWHFLHHIGLDYGYEQWSNNMEKVKKIFQWRKSVKSCTKGINILKEPIVGPWNGKKIALFLMDTQGMFDHNASERNQTFLGTFSFLLSSFVFFNVDKAIHSTHLESIYKFASNLRGSDGCFTLQNGALMFVVRDWISVKSEDNESSDEDVSEQNFMYGTDGGEKYFKALIHDFPSKATEHQMMREYLGRAFGESIPCCLLPHPGNKLDRKTFSVVDLNEDFRTESFKFFQQTTRENKIKIKEIQTKPCKCGELYEAIKDYANQLGPHLNVTDRESFLMKDFRVKMSRHLKNCVNSFTECLSFIQKGKEAERFEVIAENLEELKSQMILKFQQEAGEFFSGSRLSDWEAELNRVLSQAIRNIKTCRNVEEVYKTAIVKFTGWLQDKKMEDADFAAHAREERDSLMQELKKNISLSASLSEQIFEQCKEYFVNHTNKLIADIDDDIQDFLKMVTKKDFVVFSLNLTLGALNSDVTESQVTLRGATNGDTTKVCSDTDTFRRESNITRNTLPFSNDDVAKRFFPLTRKGFKNTSEKFFQNVLAKTFKNRIPCSSSDLSQELQLFQDGEMVAMLSFGSIKFKLKVRKTLEENSEYFD